MNKIFLTFYLLIISAGAMVANAQSSSWFISTESQSIIIQEAVQLADHSIIIAGTIPDQNDSIWWYSLSNIVVARIAADGSVMWAKKSNETGAMIYGLAEADNHIFISYSYANYDSVTNNCELMKMDLNGNIITNISQPNDFGNYGHDKFLKLPNNNLVLMRSVFSQFQVQCFDTDLNLLWSRRQDPDSGIGKNPSMNLCMGNDGNLFICGKRTNSLEIISMSPSGQFLFGKTYDDSAATSYMRAYNVFPVSDGYIIQGLYENIFNMYTVSSFAVKTDLQGNLLWSKSINDANNSDYDFAITTGAALPSGNFVFAGYSNTQKIIIGEMDGNGNIVWSRMVATEAVGYFLPPCVVSVSGNNIVTSYAKDIYPYGSGMALVSASRDEFFNNDFCDFIENEVAVTDLNITFIVSDVPAANMTTLPSAYAPENFLMSDFTSSINSQVICSTVDVANIETENSFSIYPNPASSSFQLTLKQPVNNGKLEIINTLGEKITEQPLTADLMQTIQLKNVAVGIYQVLVTGDNFSIKSKLIIQ